MNFKAVMLIIISIMSFGCALWDGFHKDEGLPVLAIIMIVLVGSGWFIGYGIAIVKSCWR
jgi:hypothetical protein